MTITHKGFFARATSGKGEKRIPISEVRAVELKPAGPVVNGCIEFAIAGGIEARSRLDHQTPRAAKNENSVIFTQRQAAAFEALRDAAEEAIAARHPGNADASASVAVPDRIASALRDKRSDCDYGVRTHRNRPSLWQRSTWRDGATWAAKPDRGTHRRRHGTPRQQRRPALSGEAVGR